MQISVMHGFYWMQEVAPNTFFPAELGLDYLHGISFEKGCYVGQELTARTHFQGLVRKRVLPCFIAPRLALVRCCT